MKKRKDISEKYKWDLSRIYSCDEDFEKDIKKCEELGGRLENYRGKLSDADSFLEQLKLSDQLDVIQDKLSVYVQCKVDEDLSDGKNQERSNSFSSRIRAVHMKLSFIEEEIKNLPKEYLEGLIKDPRFEEYKLLLINYIRFKKYMLSEKENRIINLMGSFSGGFSQVFSSLVNADLKFEPVIDKNGKKHTLTQSNLITFYMNPDRNIRRQARDNINKGFLTVQNALAANYICNLKKDWALTQMEGFESSLQRKMYADNLSQDVYDTLIANIKKQIPLSDKYFVIRKRFLGIPDYKGYDDYLPLTKIRTSYTFEQAHGLIIEALAVLGKDYVELLQKSVTERWLDVYPNENKRGGGYSTGSYKTLPYILLNFEGRFLDVLTLAHELGHSLHNYYSSRHCAPNNWYYSIICAEVASTVNEIITIKYLYQRAKTKKEKINYLNQYISEFIGTVFTQAFFSMFEHRAHELVEKNLPISRDILTKEYNDLFREFEGIKKENKKSVGWMRIPHFYSSYYVYKYCLGFISAVCITKNILEGKKGALESYKKFLKAGGKEFTLDTLKIAGVDLTSSEPYDIAFSDMKWALDELEKLTKK